MAYGTLYIVATPIGNLEDISERTRSLLSSVDTIACEDTRVSKKLLAAIGSSVRTVSYHHHSGDTKTEQIIALLQEGKDVALLSDAGTPGVADPGGKLVAAVTEALPEVIISPIPGPSALMSALSVSGFAADQFVFLGWPPHKKGRETWFRQLTEESRVVVFYESVHRIEKALEKLIENCPERNMVLARELTKQFETLYRGTPIEVLEQLRNDTVKGEFVAVVDRVTN